MSGTEDTVHIYPPRESLYHILVGTSCPCKPLVEELIEGGRLIIHNQVVEESTAVAAVSSPPQPNSLN